MAAKSLDVEGSKEPSYVQWKTFDGEVPNIPLDLALRFDVYRAYFQRWDRSREMFFVPTTRARVIETLEKLSGIKNISLEEYLQLDFEKNHKAEAKMVTTILEEIKKNHEKYVCYGSQVDLSSLKNKGNYDRKQHNKYIPLSIIYNFKSIAKEQGFLEHQGTGDIREIINALINKVRGYYNSTWTDKITVTYTKHKFWKDFILEINVYL